ncbi:hypothetical protein NUM3379_27480 [Kineococcus sp. NUM-3379]
MSGLVVLTRGLPRHRVGGMESVAWDLARALAAAGSPVTVLTTALPGRAEVFTEDGVRVRALAGTPPGRYSRAWWRLSRRALGEELRAGPVAGVLSVSAAAFGCLDLAGTGPRFVMQAHGTSVMELRSKLSAGALRPLLTAPRNAHGLLRDLRSYRRFDAVVAVGPSVAESLSSFPLGRWAGVPPVRTITNGVDTAVFRPDPAAGAAVRAALGVPAGARVLLAAGRLHPQKRVDRAVRCLADLVGAGGGREGPGPYLLVAGEGPEEARLRALAGELGVTGRVRLTGALDRGGMAAYYSAADVCVLTSAWREGLPMSVLESLACGTPAVTPLTTAPVQDAGDAVTRVDAGDAGALAGAVAGVLARGGRGAAGTGRAAGEGPRRSVLPPRYELGRVAREYDGLLRGIIDQ